MPAATATPPGPVPQPARPNPEPASLRQQLRTVNEILTQRQRRRGGALPNFIGVGAGRTGTSTLFRMLDNHPDVYMSPVKEVNFFGVRARESAGPFGMSLEDYQLLFLGHDGQAAIGEISPVYLPSPEACEQMARHIPWARIIVQIREPVARFHSQFWHHQNLHKEPDFTKYTADAIAGLPKGRQHLRLWFHPTSNLLQSFYADAIARYQEAFGAQNVFVLVFEDLIADQEAAFGDICAFLGIPPPAASAPVHENRSVPAGSLLPAPELARLRELFAADMHRTGELIGRDLTRLWAPPAAAIAAPETYVSAVRG